MSYIYIVRHGQSEGNLLGGFAGRLDYNLSSLGRTQAQMTADFLKDEKIDLIFASPLIRAYDTACPIALSHNLEITKRDDLMEINFGDWEGISVSEINKTNPQAFETWISEMHKSTFPAGESVADCFERAKNAINDILFSNPQKDICIVSHGAFIKALLCYLHGYDISDISKIIWADNASVTKISFENGIFNFIYEGESSHMGELATGVSKEILSK